MTNWTSPLLGGLGLVCIAVTCRRQVASLLGCVRGGRLHRGST